MRLLTGWLRRPERPILCLTLLLCGFGLVMVYSSSAVLGMALAGSSSHFFEAQIPKLLIGLALLAAAWRLIDVRRLNGRPANIVMGAAVGLLVLLFAHPGGSAGGSADRWLPLPFGLTVQPSELARIALVVFLASYVSRKEGTLPVRRLFLVPGGVIVLTAGLIALQPNLSMALLTLMLAAGVLFLAGLPIRWLGLATGVPAAVAVIAMRPYQRERILSFLGLAGRDASYQLDQSITAVGSGGVFGLGVGNGLQKYFYLPFPHTDFILGIVGEETGLVGITLLLAAYGGLIAAGIVVARRVPDRFGSLLAAGLTWNLALNVLLHGCVNLGMGPVTGVPLPFLSCGGSSLMANLVAVGLLLAVARRSLASPAGDWSSWSARRSPGWKGSKA